MISALRLTLWPIGPTTLVVAAIGGLVALDLARDFGPWYRSLWGNASDAAAAAFSLPEPAHPEEVVNYTLFRTLPYKNLHVTTGLHYETAGAVPSRQYCYVERQRRAGASVVLMVAASRGTGQDVAYRPISPRDAEPFGLDADELSAVARSFCRFVGTDAGTDVPDNAPITGGRPA